ncbi:MAG: hypothetical protein ACOX3L_07705 [Lutisporaceae bacterium]|jgi:hypothetical protein
MDIKSIIDLLENSSAEYVVLSAVAIFAIWLFKEFRNRYLEVIKLNHERIINALKIYADIYLILHEDTNKDNVYYGKVSEKLALGYPYYTRVLLDKVMNWQKEKNDTDFNSIKELLEKETKYLKSLQNDDISAGIPGNLFIDSIYYFFRRSNISSFIIPALYTFVFIILLFLLVLFGFLINKVDGKIQVLYYSTVLAFFFLFLTSTTTIELVFSKKLRLDIRKWFLFIVYNSVTVALLFIGPWYRGIVNIVIILGYMYIFGKYFKKE